jgi:sugar phosphate isomerase/epimerase
LIRCQTRATIHIPVSNVPQQPPFSISQVSTLTATFAEDVQAYAAAGVDGCGIWEMKLGEGSLEEFRASGLGSATAVPAVPSVQPLPLLPGPDTARERIAALLHSLEVLAPYAPAAVLCFTGPGDRETAVQGVRTVAREAEQLGLRLAVEPFQLAGIESWSILNTLGDAARFVEEVDSDAVGIQFDVWHLWNTPDVLEEIPRHAHLIAGVHVGDWREPTRGWADRVLPGDGAADLPAILGALEGAGWDGFYDLEIFSDNGAFGSAYPDSLWDLDAAELARRGRDAFFNCWSERRVAATAAGRRGDT